MEIFTLQKRGKARIVLVLGSLFILSACASLALAKEFTAEDISAKQLKPSEGQSVVYFSYNGLYNDVEVSLDGMGSRINTGMYVAWEIPAGPHHMEVIIPHSGNSSRTFRIGPGRTYYYSLLNVMMDEETDGFKLYYSPNGQSSIDVFRLASHFRDGQLVYRHAGL